MVLDGLTGAGVIKDDSFNNIELVLKAVVDKDNAGVEIIVKEMKGKSP